MDPVTVGAARGPEVSLLQQHLAMNAVPEEIVLIGGNFITVHQFSIRMATRTGFRKIGLIDPREWVIDALDVMRPVATDAGCGIPVSFLIEKDTMLAGLVKGQLVCP